MTLTDTTRRIQRLVGVTEDGTWGPNTATAVEKALGAAGKPAERISEASANPQQSAAPAPSDAFERALDEILQHEGGFVNHPRDPGGMTNLGVTRKTWEGWTGKPASEADMRALTPAKVASVYRKNYWDKLRCGELPAGLALCVFDFGVNAGPGRAARYLQRACGAVEDGEVGGATIAAARAWVARVGEAGAVKQYQDARRGYYRSLGTFPTFGRGWLRRVDEVEAEAKRMAG